MSDSLWSSFSQNFHYISGGYDDLKAYQSLSALLDEKDRDNGTSGNRIYYLSTPPNVFESIISNLGAAGLAREDKGYSRIVIEKPFGHDLDSAKELNLHVREVFREHQIYRIDHYLEAKKPSKTYWSCVSPIPSSSPFGTAATWTMSRSPLPRTWGWGAGPVITKARAYCATCSKTISSRSCVSSRWSRRSAYEEPTHKSGTEKLKILKSIRPFDQQTLTQWTVAGAHYGPGYLAGERVPGYRQEEGVDPKSITPTYAAIKVFLDTWRWHGVPFLLRSGKRLPKRTTEVAIQFKGAPQFAV